MTIAQSVHHVLRTYPTARRNFNNLLMAYWVTVDGFPTRQKDFGQTTPAESIVREARSLFARHPELSPEAAKAEGQKANDLFTELSTLFPHAQRLA